MLQDKLNIAWLIAAFKCVDFDPMFLMPRFQAWSLARGDIVHGKRGMD